MKAFPIRNDADLARAIEMVDALWEAPPDSDDARLLEVMSELIHHYEARHLSAVLPTPNPREVIAARLRELGWSQREAGRRLGWSSGRVSEVLSGARALTLAMVQALAETLALDPRLLVADASGSRRADGATCAVRIPDAIVEAAAARRWGGYGSLDALLVGLLSGWVSAGPDLMTSTVRSSVPKLIGHGVIRGATTSTSPAARVCAA